MTHSCVIITTQCVDKAIQTFILQIYIGTTAIVDYMEIPIDTSTCDPGDVEQGGLDEGIQLSS